MANFLITISFDCPYPRRKAYRIEGSNFRSAMGKAIGLWRKENRRRKIKEITIKATRL